MDTRSRIPVRNSSASAGTVRRIAGALPGVAGRVRAKATGRARARGNRARPSFSPGSSLPAGWPLMFRPGMSVPLDAVLGSDCAARAVERCPCRSGLSSGSGRAALGASNVVRAACPLPSVPLDLALLDLAARACRKR
ncbi:hypothetical protein ACFPN7_02600 [Amycolatopsis halotolerans]|uniref:hypothetical protein n=1 Tax=Amycolatopsis halotolerans TaxID=330083 RepID=UPI0036209029